MLYPTRSHQVDPKHVFTNPRLGRVPICIVFDGDDDRNSPKPHLIGVHSGFALADGVEVVVGFKQTMVQVKSKLSMKRSVLNLTLEHILVCLNFLQHICTYTRTCVCSIQGPRCFDLASTQFAHSWQWRKRQIVRAWRVHRFASGFSHAWITLQRILTRVHRSCIGFSSACIARAPFYMRILTRVRRTCIARASVFQACASRVHRFT